MQVDFNKPIQMLWKGVWVNCSYMGHNSIEVVTRLHDTLETIAIVTPNKVRNSTPELTLCDIYDKCVKKGFAWRSTEGNLEAFLEELRSLGRIKILK